MSQWVFTSKDNPKLPPCSMGVLLYIVKYGHRGDGKKCISDGNIILGFWSDEMEENESGFYIDIFDDHIFIDKYDDRIKVIAWTLLPEMPRFEGNEHMFYAPDI